MSKYTLEYTIKINADTMSETLTALTYVTNGIHIIDERLEHKDIIGTSNLKIKTVRNLEKEGI